MENTQEIKKDKDIGAYINRTLKVKLSGLLKAERLKCGLSYRDIAQECGLRAKDIAKVELGREKVCWGLMGMMLRYFHKRVVLELVDNPDEAKRNLVYARMRDKPEGYALDVIELTE
ncbi:MAG: hypothetical protein NC218_08670 [Acetobacter sp.]|nr:hypothetical protein [Acetobacter sp.]